MVLRQRVLFVGLIFLSFFSGMILSCSQERPADVPVTLISPALFSTNSLPLTLVGTLAYSPQILPYFAPQPSADFSVSNIQVHLLYEGTNIKSQTNKMTNKLAVNGTGSGFSVSLSANYVLSNAIFPAKVEMQFLAPVEGKLTRFYSKGTFDDIYIVVTN